MRQQGLFFTLSSICLIFVLHFGQAQAADPVIIKHTSPVYDICFSPDGKYLAIAGGQTVRLWNVKNRTFVRSVNITRTRAYTVDFSHDGELIAVGGISAMEGKL